jgi:hypothetical protein
MTFDTTRELNNNHRLGKTPYVGVVIDNVDPSKTQRVRIRIHDIHRNVKDEELPWAIPLSLLRQGSNVEIGDAGPIPTLGSRILCVSLDDSGYYWLYHGGSVSDDRILKELVGTPGKRPEPGEEATDKGSNEGSNMGKGLGAVSVEDQDDATEYPAEFDQVEVVEDDPADPVEIEEGITADYPYSYGHIDRSGNKWMINTKKDQIVVQHVSGTSLVIDGKGRIRVNVAEQKVGQDAKSKVQQLGVYFNVKGNAHIKANERVVLDAQKTVVVHAKDNVKVDSKKSIQFRATEDILFFAGRDIKAGAEATFIASGKATAILTSPNTKVTGDEVLIFGDVGIATARIQGTITHSLNANKAITAPPGPAGEAGGSTEVSGAVQPVVEPIAPRAPAKAPDIAKRERPKEEPLVDKKEY